MEERARVEGAGAYVGEGVEVLAEFEEARLGIWVGGAPVKRDHVSKQAARRQVSQLFSNLEEPQWLTISDHQRCQRRQRQLLSLFEARRL